jgi:hypothetical protein
LIGVARRKRMIFKRVEMWARIDWVSRLENGHNEDK